MVDNWGGSIYIYIHILLTCIYIYIYICKHTPSLRVLPWMVRQSWLSGKQRPTVDALATAPFCQPSHDNTAGPLATVTST